MKTLMRWIVKPMVANVGVVLALILMPVFLITSDIEVFNKLIDFLSVNE